MSSGLQQTKRRIASVNSTKKITKAMQLVATAKLKTMKKNVSSTSLYADEVRFLMESLFHKIPQEDWEKVLLGSEEKVNCEDKKVYVVVSSSLGLCGGYNYALFKHAASFINKEKDFVVAIGTKGLNYFKNRNYHVEDAFVDTFTHFSYEKVNKIIKYLLYLYRSGKCNQIVLIYTHYKNQITFEPKTEDLFPFTSIEKGKMELTRKEIDMILEPDAASIAAQLFPLYLKSILYSRLNESFLSEYASRRNAMENATNNAEDIVSQLQIEFNKARQAAITQEITEVVGGANASK